MISVRLMGRLGNMMFQEASARGLAHKMGYDFGYDILPWHVVPWGYHDIYPPDNVMLIGYMQSEKYFLNIKDEIKAMFMPDKGNIDAIALHVRLGDYGSEKHPICSREYYRKAVEAMPKKDILVFSDEPGKAMKYLDFGYFVAGNSEYEDLRLMASCNYHIIANSTFSWWGAWLADSKKVIAPRKWFGTGLDSSDIYAKEWIVM